MRTRTLNLSNHYEQNITALRRGIRGSFPAFDGRPSPSAAASAGGTVPEWLCNLVPDTASPCTDEHGSGATPRCACICDSLHWP
mmetsp:Transcript_22117/g.47835  ORF Transcript_22117/g.47835 Transcript_22117/m.47835 type:complete len:84 (+) Transcript_22117:263-514(+)